LGVGPISKSDPPPTFALLAGWARLRGSKPQGATQGFPSDPGPTETHGWPLAVLDPPHSCAVLMWENGFPYDSRGKRKIFSSKSSVLTSRIGTLQISPMIRLRIEPQPGVRGSRIWGPPIPPIRTSRGVPAGGRTCQAYVLLGLGSSARDC
jgi:hypothetical protein